MPSSRPIKFTYTLEERIERLRAQVERFQAPPSGDELTRALALGTWYSFFGDYAVYRPEVLRGLFAAVHKAATDYLIKLAATMGIDGTPLNSAGVLCRRLAKQTGLTDPEAETCLWPDCLGRHRYELTQGEQATIEAGERVIQKLRLKLGASPATAAGPEATAAELIGLVAPDGAQVLFIAQNSERTAEERMRLIVTLDQRCSGFSSEKWASLLGVKSAAIRKTDYWKTELRAAE